MAPLVTFAAGMPEKFGFFFFFLYFGAILIPDVRLGLPNGLFSLPFEDVCLFVCLPAYLFARDSQRNSNVKYDTMNFNITMQSENVTDQG